MDDHALVGAAVGLLSWRFPQTLFWGEGSLQHMLDGQHTPLAAVWPGLSTSLTAHAAVAVTAPFGGAQAAAMVPRTRLEPPSRPRLLRGCWSAAAVVDAA